VEDRKFICRLEPYKIGHNSEILCYIFYFDRVESPVKFSDSQSPMNLTLNKTLSSKYSVQTKRMLQNPHFEFYYDKNSHMMIGGERMSQMMTLNSKRIEEEDEEEKNLSENENSSPLNG
jgi:hypothetical protein